MKVDSIGKPLLVTETPATNLDHLYPAVETFCRTITDLQNNRIQYSPQVLLNDLGYFLDRAVFSVLSRNAWNRLFCLRVMFSGL